VQKYNFIPVCFLCAGRFGSFDFAPAVGLCGWGKGKCAKCARARNFQKCEAGAFSFFFVPRCLSAKVGQVATEMSTENCRLTITPNGGLMKDFFEGIRNHNLIYTYTVYYLHTLSITNQNPSKKSFI
jgi:hypothetical protein